MGGVFVANGAIIDVSGVQNVGLAMSSNQIDVNVQGNELRDSPQNRDGGKLINSNLWIDARDLILVPDGTGGYAGDRYYTAGGLLEVGGQLANTAHTIGEWTAVGGTIMLSAPEIVAQQGSTFNISGGSLQYEGGYLNQSYLLGNDGRIYNVNNAPANLTYVAIADGIYRQSPARWHCGSLPQCARREQSRPLGKRLHRGPRRGQTHPLNTDIDLRRQHRRRRHRRREADQRTPHRHHRRIQSYTKYGCASGHAGDRQVHDRRGQHHYVCYRQSGHHEDHYR